MNIGGQFAVMAAETTTREVRVRICEGSAFQAASCSLLQELQSSISCFIKVFFLFDDNKFGLQCISSFVSYGMIPDCFIKTFP